MSMVRGPDDERAHLPPSRWEDVHRAFEPDTRQQYAAAGVATSGPYEQALDDWGNAAQVAHTNWLAANGWLPASSAHAEKDDASNPLHGATYAPHLKVPGLLAAAARQADAERVAAEVEARQQSMRESRRQLLVAAKQNEEAAPKTSNQTGKPAEAGFGTGKARPRSRMSRALAAEEPIALPQHKPRRTAEESIFKAAWRSEVAPARRAATPPNKAAEARKAGPAPDSKVTDRLLSLFAGGALDGGGEEVFGPAHSKEVALPYGTVDPRTFFEHVQQTMPKQPPPPERTEVDELMENAVRDGPLEVIGGVGARSLPAVEREAMRRARATSSHASKAVESMVAAARMRHHRIDSPMVDLDPIDGEDGLELP